jgi:predicted nucleotidyltransferase component of viral defense system
MLDKETLLNYKTFKDPYQVEKDYLQDLVLYDLYARTESSFVFKGGTALSKFYSSDRFSEDIDFTLTGFNTNLLRELFDKIVKNLEYPTVYAEKPTENKFGTIKFSIIINGPRYSGKASTNQHISIEINTKSILFFKPVIMSRIPVYGDSKNYTALVMDAREMLAEKIRALISPNRRHKERDLYDVYFLLGKKIHAQEKLVENKLNEAGIKMSTERLLKAIDEVEVTWSDLEPFVQHKLESFHDVKSLSVKELSEIFK